MATPADEFSPMPRLFQRALAVFTLLLGAVMAAGGVRLVFAGGSLYYLVAGLALVISALLLWQCRRAGAILLWLTICATWLWALGEVGLNAWALAPRVTILSVLGLLLLWGRDTRARGGGRLRWWVTAGVAVALGAGFMAAQKAGTPAGGTAAPAAGPAIATEWPSWGNAPGGSRYAQVEQLTPANVAGLKVAWTFATGATPHSGGAPALAFEATPLKIGNTLYACSPHNLVFAIDAVSGRQIWRYDPKVDETGLAFANCRGVAYAKLTDIAPGQPCVERLYMGTIDARLVAIDARTGRTCADFGDNGQVSMRRNVGGHEKIYYYHTSVPVVSGKVVVIGSYGLDGQTTNQPSGVIRAYDLRTGALAWDFDPADPARATPLGPDETYVPGTPNSWSVSSTDEALGLVYVPFGVATPDYYGGERSPAGEAYSNTIVALDNQTGLPRWSFQVVHHDVWDYDIASQPVLTDVRLGKATVPALITVSKTGQTFMLDRRTGKPLAGVVEKPVPQGGAPGEHLSPTQPFSVGMPHFSGDRLREAQMWGLTPLDQLWCRIEFNKYRYDGMFTPPSLKGSIQYPGFAGGVNWGSVSVDEGRRLLIVNSLNLATRSTLITPQEARARGMAPAGGGHKTSPEAVRAGVPQLGARYAVLNGVLMSPLGVPCLQPPYGEISAVDLDSRKLVWRKPLGNADRMGPMGLASRLPFPFGLPTVGGAITTSGGLTFIAATPDKRIRAYETASGRLLWQADLPANGNANPMTYIGADGRQYVVIAAGGSGALATNEKNILVAFALPR